VLFDDIERPKDSCPNRACDETLFNKSITVLLPMSTSSKTPTHAKLFLAGGAHAAAATLPGVLLPAFATTLFFSKGVIDSATLLTTFTLASICGSVIGYSASYTLAGLLRGQVATVMSGIVGKMLIAIALGIGYWRGMYSLLIPLIAVTDVILAILYLNALPDVRRASSELQKAAPKQKSRNALLLAIAAVDGVIAAAAMLAPPVFRELLVLPPATSLPSETAMSALVADNTILALGALFVGEAVAIFFAATTPRQVGAIVGGAVTHAMLGWAFFFHRALLTPLAVPLSVAEAVIALAMVAALPSAYAQYSSAVGQSRQK
jgi:hypothetical protein